MTNDEAGASVFRSSFAAILLNSRNEFPAPNISGVFFFARRLMGYETVDFALDGARVIRFLLGAGGWIDCR